MCLKLGNGRGQFASARTIHAVILQVGPTGVCPILCPPPNPTECYPVAERRCKPLWMQRLSHLVAIRSVPCNLLILRAHNLRSQMLYPAELRARAAILSKFKGDAVDGGRWVCARAESRETQRRTELRIGRGEGATKRRGMQRKNWWAWVDLNYRPHPYQGCALAT